MSAKYQARGRSPRGKAGERTVKDVATKLVLQRSDLDLVRVLEDLIEVLCAKGAIDLDDLPLGARNKIIQRRALRRAK
jgi:hypothetical protein